MEIKSYTIDLNPMYDENEPIGVVCRTEEESKELFAAFQATNPDALKKWTSEFDNHWFANKEDTMYTMFYRDYNRTWKMRNGELMFGPASAHIRDGYKIVPFADLIVQPDINESEMPIESILGLN